ncbi:MAG: ribonuclease III [Pseudanabaenaceae cyanobacterium bins.39]|nr:ribonuclease III [Pseudanabaenaceae cyanobacterium bins.39]
MLTMIDPRRQRELVRLLEQIGLDVKQLEKKNPNGLDWLLIDQALLHPSFSSTHNNDQLEFVGDSVLKLSVSLFLREKYGNKKVGELSALRSHLVSDKNLAQIAKSYDLQKYIVLSDTIRKNTQNAQATEQTVLANSMEALIAAIYLVTNDINLVRQWLDPHMLKSAEAQLQLPALGNYKVSLQELTQRHWRCLPDYRNVTLPEDNLFTMEVWFADRCWGKGQGKSMKSAQQAAAALALAEVGHVIDQLG